MTTIVIPLHHGGGKLKDDSELRFALRSIAANFTDFVEVVIIGRKLPRWVKGVTFIQQRAKGLKTALHMAAKAYPDGFFWFYDDCCILKPIDTEEMKVTPCSRGWSKPHTTWARKLDGIRARLEAEGKKAWDYSRPHGPYWFDKSMIDEAFRDWPGMDGKLPVESWILSKRNWPRRHSGYKQYYGPFRGAPGEHQQFLNYNNKGFTLELREWLSQKFQEMSRFEQEPPPIDPASRVRGVVLALTNRPRWESACVEEMATVGIDLQLFEGHDGHDGTEPPMKINVPAFRKDFKREPLPGEIGCYASHINFARKAESLPPFLPEMPGWRLMFEDDAVPVEIDAAKLIEIATMADEQCFDVVMLHTGRNNRRGHGPTNVGPTNGKDVFTHAYLANLHACKEMSGWEMRHPIDHAISRSKRLRVGVLWGPAKFNQRSPGESEVSIHRERKAAYAGRSFTLAPVTSSVESTTPQAVHQVWIGGSPMPARLEAYCDTIRRAFPGWGHRLWTEDDMPALAAGATLPDVVLGIGHWGDRGLCMGVRSDVVRLEILRQHGGIYFDTDFEALRGDLRPLFDGIRGFAYSDQRDGLPGIGVLFASQPGNPFVELYLRRIAASLAKPSRPSDVLEISGPDRIRECLNYWMGRWNGGSINLMQGQRIRADYAQAGISAFFAEVMHPYWFGTGTWATFDPAKHPKAWAAHHWEAGWKK